MGGASEEKGVWKGSLRKVAVWGHPESRARDPPELAGMQEKNIASATKKDSALETSPSLQQDVWQGNLRKKGFIVAHIPRLQPTRAEKAWLWTV